MEKTISKWVVDGTWSSISCCKCLASFAVPTSVDHTLRSTKREFWCPCCGTSLWFPRSTLEVEQERREAAERDAVSAREEAARARKMAAQEALHARMANAREAKARKQRGRILTRVHGGACPHCTRTFKDLARHMESKHGGLPGARHLLCDGLTFTPAKEPTS